MRFLKGKKGVLGLDTTKAVILGLLTLAVLAVAVILALNVLGTSGIVTNPAGTTYGPQNYTQNILNNVSAGTATFFSYVPTFFILLAVVVLILIIAIVIVAVSRFGGGATRESL